MLLATGVRVEEGWVVWSWILGLNVGLVLKLVAGFGGRAMLNLRVVL